MCGIYGGWIFRTHFRRCVSSFYLRVIPWVHTVERDNRGLSHLDLHPHLRLHSVMKKIDGTPAHFTLYNAGPVDAVQVEIYLSILCFSTESRVPQDSQ